LKLTKSRSSCAVDRGQERVKKLVAALSFVFAAGQLLCGAAPREVSGIYPDLAMFNREGECGTGAVVPWADRLWVITYGPHRPNGSSDKLYEITPDLRQIIRPESVGGTPANRMIHPESQQLVIGPYFIDSQRNVRVIPPKLMPGRLTANARHLTDPAGKLYFATMEEGFYEVDVKSLAVTELYRDANGTTNPAGDLLPGYHGKGLYSAQGRLVYANNGELSNEAQIRPDIVSGCLAEWDGRNWQVVRRNQFTEVSGPGGLDGNTRTNDPLWSIGWDRRSLILMLLDGGRWQAFRLPKASHTYDGAHGWFTEWPRIRDIGEPGRPDLLMTMHGMFWRFPRTFSRSNTAGLAPRSTYLKIIGDFCRWHDRIVIGCDDATAMENSNGHKAKGALAPAGKSQSNLWFVKPADLDALGPALGRGAVWLDDPVKAGVPSDPYLFSGFIYRSLHLAHDSAEPVTFTIEVDARGDGAWKPLRKVDVPAHGYAWTAFAPGAAGAWVRVIASRDCAKASAFFHCRNAEPRRAGPEGLFDGLARPGEENVSGGLLHPGGGESPLLRFLAGDAHGDIGCYALDGELKLRRANDPQLAAWMRKNVAIPTNVLTVDAASVLLVDQKGRWRLPKGDAAFDPPEIRGGERVCREVCTERDLFNVHGTFYELPAQSAGGFARIRPIATHNLRINDFASYRGLLVLSGVSARGASGNQHIIRSEDGKCALWVGAVDDLWCLGKPCGTGGPWKDCAVKAGVPSDPYLMSGYDHKHLTLSHLSRETVAFRVEVDFSGTGQWVAYRECLVKAGKPWEHDFPDAFAAYWVRVVSDQDTTATARFVYD
jgi:hypothetical protein